jgi:hypothetical protein
MLADLEMLEKRRDKADDSENHGGHKVVFLHLTCPPFREVSPCKAFQRTARECS